MVGVSHKNFETSFDVEEGIVEVIYAMSALPETVSEIELYDRTFLDLDLLTRRRVALEEKRMSLLREFPHVAKQCVRLGVDCLRRDHSYVEIDRDTFGMQHPFALLPVLIS